MEIILLEKIRNLGELGDQVVVKAGYARNYLIPQHKAVRATDDAKAKIAERRKELLKLASERLDVAKARASVAEGITLQLSRKVGEEGKLFGSVTAADITEALNENTDAEFNRSEVNLPEGPIKSVGDFEVAVIVHPEVHFKITVSVIGEE